MESLGFYAILAGVSLVWGLPWIGVAWLVWRLMKGSKPLRRGLVASLILAWGTAPIVGMDAYVPLYTLPFYVAWTWRSVTELMASGLPSRAAKSFAIAWVCTLAICMPLALRAKRIP